MERLLNSLYNLIHSINYRWLMATAVIKFVWDLSEEILII